MTDAIYLIDGYSLIYRSYFALIRSPLRSPDGRNTSAIYGFFRSLFGLRKLRNPQRMVIAMDSLGPTFRKAMYSEYKANRQETPEDLRAQIPLIEEALGYLGIPRLRAEGYEADDVIATLAGWCRKENIPCFIFSGDKDLLQLVGGSVKILYPEKGSQIFDEWGEKEVFEKRGVTPEQIVDYLALTGDSSDNIPGVTGIGAKTAAKLLSEYSSVEDIYRSLEEIKSESWRKKLREGRESAFLSRSLVVLKTDVPLEKGLESLQTAEVNHAKARELFHKEGIRTFEAEIGGPSVESAGLQPAAEPEAKQLEHIQAGQYECVLDVEALDSWVKMIRAEGSFAFDTETDSLDEITTRPIGFSLAVRGGRGCYIPVPYAKPVAEDAHLGEQASLEIETERQVAQAPYLDEELVRSRLRELLTDPSLKLIGQNIKFDYKVMKRWGIEMANIHFDTMVAAWLLDATRTAYNLDRLAEDLLGYGTIHYGDLVDGKKARTLLDVPLERVTDYAAEDADIAHQSLQVFPLYLTSYTGSPGSSKGSSRA
jgi:DNA polymerase-1